MNIATAADIATSLAAWLHAHDRRADVGGMVTTVGHRPLPRLVSLSINPHNPHCDAIIDHIDPTVPALAAWAEATGATLTLTPTHFGGDSCARLDIPGLDHGMELITFLDEAEAADLHPGELTDSTTRISRDRLARAARTRCEHPQPARARLDGPTLAATITDIADWLAQHRDNHTPGISTVQIEHTRQRHEATIHLDAPTLTTSGQLNVLADWCDYLGTGADHDDHTIDHPCLMLRTPDMPPWLRIGLHIDAAIERALNAYHLDRPRHPLDVDALRTLSRLAATS